MHVTYFLPVLYAFAACLGSGGLHNLHGRPVFWAAVGGALGWLAYLLTLLFAPDLFAGFVSAAVVAFYAEVLARLQKRTVTTYLLIGIIPMVPGAGIYHTMEYCIQGNTALFIEEGLHTLGMAGALAIGILVVESTWRMIRQMQRRLIGTVPAHVGISYFGFGLGNAHLHGSRLGL